MKIMSLNVNRFSGMNDRDFTKSIENLDECPKANEIIEYVKKFLGENPDGVVFLHEVPYWKSNNGRGRSFRWVEKRRLYQEFCRKFRDNGFKLSTPTSEKEESPKEAYSCTLAIWKNEEWTSERGFLNKNHSRANKYVKLASSNVCVIGLHAPADDLQFLIDLKKYVKEKHDEEEQKEKLILIGDFNITTNAARTEEKLKELNQLEHLEQLQELKDKTLAGVLKVAMDCTDFFARQAWLQNIMPAIGYTDVIPSEIPTYFWMEKVERKWTTVDHVLVSPALQGRVTVVDVEEEPKLSDHAIIIVDVNL